MRSLEPHPFRCLRAASPHSHQVTARTWHHTRSHVLPKTGLFRPFEVLETEQFRKLLGSFVQRKAHRTFSSSAASQGPAWAGTGAKEGTTPSLGVGRPALPLSRVWTSCHKTRALDLEFLPHLVPVSKLSNKHGLRWDCETHCNALQTKSAAERGASLSKRS